LDQVHSHRGTPTGPWHPSVGGWGSWTPRFEIPPGFYDGLVCYVLFSSSFPPFDGSCSGDRGRPFFVGGVIAHPPAKNSNKQRSTRNERQQRHNKQRDSVAHLYQAICGGQMDPADGLTHHVLLVLTFVCGGLCERVSTWFTSPRARTSVGEVAVLGRTCDEALDRASELSAGVPPSFAGQALLWSALLGGLLGVWVARFLDANTHRPAGPADDNNGEPSPTSPTSAPGTPERATQPETVDFTTYRPARLRGKLCLPSTLQRQAPTATT
jgi:hypothetical protein